MKNGNEQACLSMLYDESCKVPGNSDVWFRYAFALDHFSKEEEAIPAYKKALKIGLNRNAELTALICLASSYRNVGEINRAKETIVQVLTEYPDHIAAQCFYSLILADSGEPEKALQVLGRALLRGIEPEVFEGFKEALEAKFSELTKTIK